MGCGARAFTAYLNRPPQSCFARVRSSCRVLQMNVRMGLECGCNGRFLFAEALNNLRPPTLMG